MPLPPGTVGAACDSPFMPPTRPTNPKGHKCDERCACPIDGLPLFYAPGSDAHACQDPECVYAHGLFLEWPDGRRWAL